MEAGSLVDNYERKTKKNSIPSRNCDSHIKIYCENVLSLIKSGINERQPWVRYNPHLSTLISARLEPLLPQNLELKELFDRLRSSQPLIMMDESVSPPRATTGSRHTRDHTANRAPNSSAAFCPSFATSLILSVIVLQAFVILDHVH
ncbi:hypothetical protein Ciccas_000167 [Cichlidogyrus casuarinus]|uniref:Uncharacterized protein n=1 Tax=Cichlidogyrus casuarinus TaxID=1844966 RepID=A0ABD2QNM6_9PLAT